MTQPAEHTEENSRVLIPTSLNTWETKGVLMGLNTLEWAGEKNLSGHISNFQGFEFLSCVS